MAGLHEMGDGQRPCSGTDSNAKASRSASASDGAREGMMDGGMVPVRSILMALVLGFVAYWQFGGVIGSMTYTPPPDFTTMSGTFRLCDDGTADNCVADGSSFVHDGTAYSVVDAEAPRLDDAACAEERSAGREAALRMLAMLNGGPFEVHPDARPIDASLRRRVTIMRDSISLGALLVSSGLAHSPGNPGKNWCSAPDA